MGSTKRRCEGIIVDRPSYLPYWKRCTAFAMHGLDYCVMCFQRRVQNDAARACLVPGWEAILVGDESRKGKGKPRLGLEPSDKEAAAAIRAKRESVEVGTPAQIVPGPTEPFLLERRRKVSTAPRAPDPLPPPPDAADDIFSAARRTLTALSKI